MTFLNPGLLIGLAAVALPILIHLLSRRRYPLIDFSSLRFLKKLQRQQMRRLRLRQWLLLLLRTLAILLIVAAFARPTLRAHLGWGILSTGRIGMAIVIDASASMQSKSLEGSSFQQAKTAAKTLISLMNPGDRTIVVLARGEPEPLTQSPSSEDDALLQALEDTRAWDGGADLAAALNAAVQQLGSAQDFRREIYVLSDFASTAELPNPPENANLFFVQITPESPENLSVKDVRVVSEIIEPGQPVEIKITLANFGLKDRDDVYYSIFLNGSRVGEDVVSLAAGGEVKRHHQVLPEDTDLQEGMVQIEEMDVLAADNRAYYCFSVPERLDVLLVGDESTCREIRLALSPASQKKSLIFLKSAGRENWDTQPISRYDVIIFCDPPDFSKAQSSRLAHFVERGGGLLILPGSHMDAAAINRDLLAKLGTPKWGEKMGQPGRRESFLSWQEPDLNSPLLRGILRLGSHPSTPRFYQTLRLVGQEGDAPIYFSNGMPFLTETIFGQGRVILCASSPEQNWSDWAQRGIFAPLLHRLVLQLAGTSRERCQSLWAGAILKVPTGSAAGASASLSLPDGQQVKLPPQVLGQKAAYIQPALAQAGIYHLKAGQTSHLAAVNIPSEESTLKQADLREVYPGWYDARVRSSPPERLAETVRQSRYGRELWKLALIACLCVLLLESALGRSTGSVAAEKEENEAM